MFTHVHICLPLITRACLLMFTHAYTCLAMFTPKTYVYHSLPGLPMFTIVYSQLFTYVYTSLLVFTYVKLC